MSSSIEDPQDIILSYSLPMVDHIFSVSFRQIEFRSKFVLNYTVIHSCSITVCLTVFMLLVLFVRNKSTPIFVLNQVILIVAMIRSTLFIGYLLSPISGLTFVFTEILSEEDKLDYRISVAANGALIVLVFLIQSSFTYQIFIIFKSPEVKKFGIMLVSLSVAFMCITFGFYVNSAVASTKRYQGMFLTGESIRMDSWVGGVPPILFSLSVIAMSLILVCKLIFALKTRRYLGLKQFLSYHILLIMFTQTLFIPTVLTILGHCFYGYSDILVHVSTTVTVVLLPFTSVWASIANNSRSLASNSLYFPGSRSILSPGYSMDNGDEDTLRGDSFAFFPEKLQKLGPSSSFSSALTQRKDNLDTENGFDLVSQKSIPNDILKILEENEKSNPLAKHISVNSSDSDSSPLSSALVKQFNSSF